MIAAACIVVAALIVLCALEGAAWAWLVGRYKRRRSYTDLVLSQPPVPDTDEELLSIPPLVFDADTTLEELEHAALAHDFATIVRREFPQYRSFRDAS